MIREDPRGIAQIHLVDTSVVSKFGNDRDVFSETTTELADRATEGFFERLMVARAEGFFEDQ